MHELERVRQNLTCLTTPLECGDQRPPAQLLHERVRRLVIEARGDLRDQLRHDGIAETACAEGGVMEEIVIGSPVTVGMSNMPYRRFIAWTTPACILWAFAYVTFGSVAAVSYRELANSLHFAGYLFVAAIVVFAVAVLVVKKLLERSAARHWDHPGDGDATTRDEPTD